MLQRGRGPQAVSVPAPQKTSCSAPLTGPAHPLTKQHRVSLSSGRKPVSLSLTNLCNPSPYLDPCYFHLVDGEKASKLFPQPSSATSHLTHVAARVTFQNTNVLKLCSCSNSFRGSQLLCVITS